MNVYEDRDGWTDLRWQIHSGDRPTTDVLIARMRQHGVPADLGDYVANRLTGKTRKRGAPTKNTPRDVQERAARALGLQYSVLRRQFELRSNGTPRWRARALAIEQVASEQKPRALAADTVRDILKTSRRYLKQAYPSLRWPTFADVNDVLSKRAKAQDRRKRAKAGNKG